MNSHIYRKQKFEPLHFQNQQPIYRPSQSNTPLNLVQQQPQTAKYKKIIKDLQHALMEEKQKRYEVEERIRDITQRSLAREKQFQRILQQVNQNVDKFTNAPTEVNKTFEKIFENFEMFNEVTNKFIENRYIENMRTMQQKISQILQTFQYELSKIKKSANLDHDTIRKQLQHIVEMALSIEEENLKYRKRIDEEMKRNKFLEEEKKILLGEVIQKKELINKLYVENKTFKNANKTITGGRNVKNLKLDGQNMGSIEKLSDIEKLKQTLEKTQRNYEDDCSFQMSSVNKNYVVSEFVTNFRSTISPQQIRRSEVGISPKRQSSLSKRSSNINSTRKSRIFSLEGKKEKQMSTPENIIHSLKSNLERQRKRNVQLTKLINKMRSQNQEINNVIAQALEQFKQSKNKNEGKDEKFLETLLKSEKLFQAIRTLKKRISIAQRPSYMMHSWVDEDFENILSSNKFEEQTISHLVYQKRNTKSSYDRRREDNQSNKQKNQHFKLQLY